MQAVAAGIAKGWRSAGSRRLPHTFFQRRHDQLQQEPVLNRAPAMLIFGGISCAWIRHDLGTFDMTMFNTPDDPSGTDHVEQMLDDKLTAAGHRRGVTVIARRPASRFCC